MRKFVSFDGQNEWLGSDPANGATLRGIITGKKLLRFGLCRRDILVALISGEIK